MYLAESFTCTFKGELTAALKDINMPRGANGGDSHMALEYLKDITSRNQFVYDTVLFNCGLHDIKTMISTNTQQVDINEYRDNLESSLDIFVSQQVKVIWVRTTKVVDEIHNSPENISLNKNIIRRNEDVLAYNEVADRIMADRNIHSIDLYSFTEKLGNEAYCDHVHFYEYIRKMQAAFIARHIENWSKN